MKWRTEARPQHGDIRVVQYFAFAPTELSDGYTVWFENYWAKEEYHYVPSEGTGIWTTLSTSTQHPDRPDTGSTKKSSTSTQRLDRPDTGSSR